jgi:uncharacterized protein
MPFSPKPRMTSFERQPGLSKHHRIELGHLTFMPHRSGAVYCADERLLLVADLHLEQGASLARRRVHVPPYDTMATLSMLEDVLAETEAARLVLLGDSFHDAVAHSEVIQPDGERLRRITARVDTIWISGNHDPKAHDTLGGTCVDELALGDVTLRHIPRRLAVGEMEIAGHLHPGASIVQRGSHVRTKCFVADTRRMILPAFGSYTGAVNVRTAAFSGLFETDAAHAWMIGRSAIHKFPWSRLG